MPDSRRSPWRNGCIGFSPSIGFFSDHRPAAGRSERRWATGSQGVTGSSSRWIGSSLVGDRMKLNRPPGSSTAPSISNSTGNRDCRPMRNWVVRTDVDHHRPRPHRRLERTLIDRGEYDLEAFRDRGGYSPLKRRYPRSRPRIETRSRRLLFRVPGVPAAGTGCWRCR